MDEQIERGDEGDQQREGGLAESGLAPLLAGVEIPVTVVVGRGRVSLQVLLQLTPGTVVELDCDLEEPVEVMVGERCIARGELVSVGGRLGVRITEIVVGEEGEAK